MQPAVVCLIDSNAEAQRVVVELLNAGIAGETLSVLAIQTAERPDVAAELDWLDGVGRIESDEFGSFIAAGPILASLAAAQEDTARGGLLGVLQALGVSADEIDGIQADLHAGRILISVQTDDARGCELARKTCEAGGVLDLRLTTSD